MRRLGSTNDGPTTVQIIVSAVVILGALYLWNQLHDRISDSETKREAAAQEAADRGPMRAPLEESIVEIWSRFVPLISEHVTVAQVTASGREDTPGPYIILNVEPLDPSWRIDVRDFETDGEGEVGGMPQGRVVASDQASQMHLVHSSWYELPDDSRARSANDLRTVVLVRESFERTAVYGNHVGNGFRVDYDVWAFDAESEELIAAAHLPGEEPPEAIRVRTLPLTFKDVSGAPPDLFAWLGQP